MRFIIYNMYKLGASGEAWRSPANKTPLRKTSARRSSRPAVSLREAAEHIKSAENALRKGALI
ncbi:hypothetical protein JS73_06965 [Synergistes jonesii]|uniref:Uncharacterized protein n=2 Tax=Synergistes jonesii TaxID=2754 RepID=A0A073IRB1_9BACT|nr:hypothetical protein EH55_04780 [Synergistes jonesii]OFB62764.1 hypothetical protein JS73_06965 [Synergistes jonesii]OFB63471.1 hypothetical protein JS79_07485 [Synergistes jonesii]OFB65486.1 hypothetical protein JS72_02200 [Synergistes jonesii]OFB67709.1 hypothetical protein JS78_06970 [Synergistes jonesii]